MDNFNDMENKNISNDNIDEITSDIPPEAEVFQDIPEFTEPVTPPFADTPAEPVAEAPKADFTEPWREPTYTSTNNVRAYSPNGYSTNANYAPRKKKAKKKKGFARAVGFILIASIICGLCGGGAAYMVTNRMLREHNINSSANQVILGSTTENNGENTDTPQSVNVTGDTLTGSQIYTLACNQVVGVNTSVTTNIFGQTSSSAVSGSGFIISSDGYILTNYHVIEYAAVYGYDLTVMLYDGTSHPAEIIGHEADNDIAVIKIDATGLNPVAFGNSEEMQVGETVYAVGNPLGELEFTMTTGSVSALDRYVTTDANTSSNMFQIDSAVNSGNSGGPVYNSRGEVAGVVTANYSSTGVEGIGFAIPIDDAVNISTQLIEHGYVSGKAYLGVNVQDITETYAYYLNLPQGAYVYSLVDGSCAQAAGIKVGDVITAVGSRQVTSSTDLKSALTNFSAGDTTDITVYRSGETMQISVTFDEKAQETQSSSPQQRQQQQQIDPYGQGGQGGQGGYDYYEYYGGDSGGNDSFNDFWNFWGYQIP